MLAHLSSASPYPVIEWARRCAGEGFESLWAPQVIGRGSLVPDPFVAIAAAAAATDHYPMVEVGTGTVQVPLHHPADLAHRMLSLMSVCGDRLALGISPGSTELDYVTFDRDHAERFATFDENLARLRPLLAHGRDQHADLAPEPAVIPPLLLGTWGALVELAAREFDGWLGSASRRSAGQLLAAHERYRAAGGGRAIAYAIPVAAGDDLGRTRDLLHRYAEAGFDDAVVLIEPEGPDPAQVRALLP